MSPNDISDFLNYVLLSRTVYTSRVIYKQFIYLLKLGKSHQKQDILILFDSSLIM